MAFKFLDNICVTLVSKLEKDATVLPINASDTAKLANALGEGNYTFMTLTTPLGSEVMKVTAECGEDVTLERAQSGTDALTGGVGKCVCFKINEAVLDALGLISPPCEVTIATDQPDYLVVTAPDEGNCDWKVNLNQDFIDRLEACCPEDECNNCTLSDGTYENATITVVNGKVCAVTNGTNVVYTGGGCCGCNE